MRDHPHGGPKNSRKHMRKGTRSCIACRRRKVRCIFSSNQSDTCIHCSRRGSICVPQGGLPRSGTEVRATELEGSFEGESPLVMAYGSLKRRIENSLDDGLRSPSPLAVATVAVDTEGTKHLPADCVPVMKLFRDGTIGHLIRPESAADGGSRNSPANSDPDNVLPLKHAEAVRGLFAALPPVTELQEILTSQNNWWQSWRDSFGLSWGEATDRTLEAFAIRVLRLGHPSLLGSLLVCLAFSVGVFERYLALVKRWILHDDDLAGCEYGLECLMGLGLCYFSALQHRSAWSVYRRANTLLQLSGIHRRHRESEKLDGIFWQLFHADRWLSLMIGLPYSIPTSLCDLSIPPANMVSPTKFHYRHLAVLTSRVIDCVQATQRPSLSTIAGIDEQIDAVTNHLPPNYLDLDQVAACQDTDQKHARIYRLTQLHQLKAYLHLPLFLQSLDIPKQEYGRAVCVSSSQKFLEAFLLLCDNPETASMDNSIKLTGFSAFTAAVTLFLDIIDRAPSTANSPIRPCENTEHDGILIARTTAALGVCADGDSNSLCGQCLTALNKLISSCQELGHSTTHMIELPYFGVVSIGPKPNSHGDGGMDQLATGEDPFFDLSASLNDLFWDYHGPLADFDLFPATDDFPTFSGRGIKSRWMATSHNIENNK